MDAGEEDVSLNVIAADAGVGVGTVYRHFPTQLALLTALVDPSLVHLAAALRELADKGGPTAVETAFRAAVELFAERREALTVISAVRTPEDAEPGALKEIRTSLEQLLRRAADAGLVRPEVTVEVLQHMVCAVDYAARLASEPAAARAVHTEIALRGILPS